LNAKPLYRSAALNARQVKWLGGIVLVRPISFTFLTAFSVILASIIVSFGIWGTYTKRSTIPGQLIPNTGLLKVYPTQPGIVMQKLVTEGQDVKQGDILFVLSSERHSSTQGDVQAAISNQVELRQQSLRDERDKTHLVQNEERTALQSKIAGLQTELGKLESEIEGQRTHVKLAEDSVLRYEGLLKQDYVPLEQAQQKREELLDQRARLQGFEREHISVARELSAQQAALASLGLKQQNQLAEIDRNIGSTSQEFTESEAKRRLVVTASESGTVTAIAAELGQSVDANHPLASIVPHGATMLAQLYAPSRAIGFVKPGDQVLLRYQAYPYQKFGHAKGVVESVSRTALPSNELNGFGNTNGNNTSEPLYRVTVNLASQTITAYGKPQSLQAGMLLDADVLQDKRHLYEWVLEPLYSLTGKL
jgi:membrane fusion protein